MRALVVVTVLSACYRYEPGSFVDGHGALAGTQVTVDCLELVVARGSDPSAQGPVVEYSFGNRCSHSVYVDLGAVQAKAVDQDGAPVKLAAYDPRNELRALRLDPRASARESIEYHLAGEPAVAADTRKPTLDELQAKADAIQRESDELRSQTHTMSADELRQRLQDIEQQADELRQQVEPSVEQQPPPAAIDPRSVCVDVDRAEYGHSGSRRRDDETTEPWICLR